MKSALLTALASVASRISTPLLLKQPLPSSIVPLYHYVSDHPESFIKHLYPVRNVDAFRRDIAFFLKHFEPITDLAELFKSPNQPGRKPKFILTFDDGLRNNSEVVAPILKEFGLPAIFFVNTAFVDNKQLFFRYKVSLLLEAYYTNKSVFLSQQVEQLLRRNQLTLVQVPAYLTACSYAQTPFLDEFANAIGLDFQHYLKQHKPYLTKVEIAQLIKDGFWIGAHSVDHPLYAQLSLEEQLQQTTQSILDVQANYNVPYQLFAFPFTDDGVSKLFFDDLKRYTQNRCITFGTAGIKFDEEPFHIQRLPMEKQGWDVRRVLNTELLYFAAKRMVAKNNIRRK